MPPLEDAEGHALEARVLTRVIADHLRAANEAARERRRHMLAANRGGITYIRLGQDLDLAESTVNKEIAKARRESNGGC